MLYFLNENVVFLTWKLNWRLCCVNHFSYGEGHFLKVLVIMQQREMRAWLGPETEIQMMMNRRVPRGANTELSNLPGYHLEEHGQLEISIYKGLYLTLKNCIIQKQINWNIFTLPILILKHWQKTIPFVYKLKQVIWIVKVWIKLNRCMLIIILLVWIFHVLNDFIHRVLPAKKNQCHWRQKLLATMIFY